MDAVKSRGGGARGERGAIVWKSGARHIHRRGLRVPGLVGQEDLVTHFVAVDLAQAIVCKGARKHHRRGLLEIDEPVGAFGGREHSVELLCEFGQVVHGREQVLVNERLGCSAARRGIFAGGAARRLLSQHVERREAAPLVLFFGFGLALRLHLRLAHALGFRPAARFFLLLAVPLRLRALVRFLFFIDPARKGIEARENVRRGSLAGRIGRDGLCVIARAGASRAPAGLVLLIAGVVSHLLSPKRRFPGEPLPSTTRQYTFAHSVRKKPKPVAFRRHLVAGADPALQGSCLTNPGRALAVRGNRFFEVFVFLAGDEADLPQGGELLLRFLHVVRQEISLAQVFARAAMARVELERALVVLEGGIELPGIAIGVTEEILDVGVAIVLQERLVQALDGALPVLRFDRLLSRGIVGSGGRCRRVLLARVRLRSRDRDEDACENKRRESARRNAASGALSAAQAGTLSPRAARLDRCRRSWRVRRASRNTRAPSPGRRQRVPPWPRRRSRAAGFARRAKKPRTPAMPRPAGPAP